MKKWTELKQFDAKENEVSVYAAIVRRGNKWTSPGMVARMLGLSMAASTSALWSLRRQEIAELRCHGDPNAFRLTKRMNTRRAELEYEARWLGLIAGPWMKPLFSVTK